MARIETIVKNKTIFNLIPKIADLQRLYGVKITKIEAIENLSFFFGPFFPTAISG
jgi:hypothetical protein